eukprot:TRINITY_DN10615_c0_g1_i1.p1 TRINITY_DN10615_c0_g1~~TRINITY_DN10615_c0_g1_i1.p1  ORF type:complete len:142 (-),score=7.59 TRINITY_DN10615_c0_g1_i1:45-428(-)
MEIAIVCVLAMFLAFLFSALNQSLMRVAGLPTKDPETFNLRHKQQLLHAEWGPWVVLLILVVYYQAEGSVSLVSNVLIVVLTGCRLLVLGKPYLPEGFIRNKFSYYSMLVCYLAFLGLTLNAALYFL